MRTAVVIPSWNGRHLLPFCLQALEQQADVDLDVIVVDNGSQDGTADWLARTHPQVQCLALSQNLGFAAATNLGLARCRHPYVLVLNNDAAVHPGYISTLVRFLDEREGAAAVQGRILSHADPTRIDSLGIRFDSLLRAHQIGWGAADRPATTPRRIPGVTACAALYRSAAMRSIADRGSPAQVFDPRFFAYYEDVDLALRLGQAGWEAWLEPAAACDHVGSATGGRDSMRKAFLLGRNYLLYLARHLGPAGLAGLLPGLLRQQLRRLATWPIHPRRDTALWCGELAALPFLFSAFRKGAEARRTAADATTVPPG